MKHQTITVHSGHSRGLFDITVECVAFVRGQGDGLLNIFVPHATAGVVIMELGAGSDSDLMQALDRLLPRDDRWRHQHGSVGHGADHVLPLMVAPSIVVPVVNGQLQLGTWQSIALLDPNQDNSVRQVELSFISG
jgi:secondary thiamine-phosphate synthase enzyme